MSGLRGSAQYQRRSLRFQGVSALPEPEVPVPGRCLQRAQPHAPQAAKQHLLQRDFRIDHQLGRSANSPARRKATLVDDVSPARSPPASGSLPKPVLVHLPHTVVADHKRRSKDRHAAQGVLQTAGRRSGVASPSVVLFNSQPSERTTRASVRRPPPIAPSSSTGTRSC
jgi:hypothetical protein